MIWIWQWCMPNFHLKVLCLCPFLCTTWYGSGQWISDRVIVNHAPIQNLVLRASFENVKSQNASKFIKWLKMPEMIRFDQHMWYQLVAKCISCTSLTIWWSQSKEYGLFICAPFIWIGLYEHSRLIITGCRKRCADDHFSVGAIMGDAIIITYYFNA